VAKTITQQQPKSVGGRQLFTVKLDRSLWWLLRKVKEERKVSMGALTTEALRQYLGAAGEGQTKTDEGGA